MLHPDIESACCVSARVIRGALRGRATGAPSPKRVHCMKETNTNSTICPLGLVRRVGGFPVDISVDYRGVEKFDYGACAIAICLMVGQA